LSAAAPSRRSTSVIDQLDSTNRNSAPRVALMIPAPTRTTSVCTAFGSDTESLVLRGRGPLSRLSAVQVIRPGLPPWAQVGRAARLRPAEQLAAVESLELEWVVVIEPTR